MQINTHGNWFKAKARFDRLTNDELARLKQGYTGSPSNPPIVYDSHKDTHSDPPGSGYIPAGISGFDVSVPCGDNYILASFDIYLDADPANCPPPASLYDLQLKQPKIMSSPFLNGNCTYNINLDVDEDFTYIGCV